MLKVILRPFGLCALAASFVLVTGRVSHAGAVPALVPGLIGDFEDATFDNLDTDGVFGATPVLTQSTTGVTRGSFSVGVAVPQGGFWGPATGNLIPNHESDLQTATTFSYDENMNAVSLNGGSGSFNGFAQSNEIAITLYGNSGATNLFLQESFSSAGISDSSGQNATWSGVDGTRHIVWDLTKFVGTDGFNGFTGDIAQILAHDSGIVDSRIGITEQTGGSSNSVGPATVFFDNMQLAPVPEPASLGLLCLGLPALLIRRRAKAC